MGALLGWGSSCGGLTQRGGQDVHPAEIKPPPSQGGMSLGPPCAGRNEEGRRPFQKPPAPFGVYLNNPIALNPSRGRWVLGPVFSGGRRERVPRQNAAPGRAPAPTPASRRDAGSSPARSSLARGLLLVWRAGWWLDGSGHGCVRKWPGAPEAASNGVDPVEPAQPDERSALLRPQ